jgi:hypothetical protein
MRNVNLGFKEASLLVGLTALGAAVITACSSTNEIIEYGDEPDAEVGEDSGSDVMDAQSERTKRDASDGGTDAKGNADATSDADARSDADASPKKDAADANFAETGTPCEVKNSIQTRKCGFCGFQERACLDPEDAGSPTWLEWGPCQQEVFGGCMPGDTMDAGCGRCGHTTVTCTNACKWPDSGTKCTDEGVCSPGDTRYKYALSCDEGGRYQGCNELCQWGAPTSECVFEDMPELLVPATVGEKASVDLEFSDAGPFLAKLSAVSCPTSITTSMVPYSYVRVRNTTGKDARVSVWHSAPDGGKTIDTIMAVYDTGARPGDNDTTARQNCQLGTTVNDVCYGNSDPGMCKGNMAGYTDVDGGVPGNTVVVPAGFLLIVYNAPYFTGTSGYGKYTVNVMTHSLSP